MQVVEFSLQKYRSIQKAEKIQLGDLTVLIGPNNEGKSNILRGLVTGMRLLAAAPNSRQARQTSTKEIYRVRNDVYNWERDFPIGMQEKHPHGATVFDFVFELSDAEIVEFKSEVKSNLNGTLPIRLTAGPDSAVTFEVKKRGPGGKALTKKRAAIARFVARRLNPQDIPAIRTAHASMRIVNDMVSTELRRLEDSAEYNAALDKIAELQRPILDEIGGNLRTMLNTFLPDVQGVELEVRDRSRRISECNIVVDDGTATHLSDKGDGVQSLAAISLIHHVAEQSPATREIVLALEEPEAHLHPKAIHQVKRVLGEIASRQQVIVTTHSPLLVNRNNLASNVIVHRRRAKPATTIAEIREVLGVRVADNLSAAEFVLLVEGSEDVKSLDALLPWASPTIGDALAAGRLVIEGMRGASNLSYRLGLTADQLCSTHVLLDYDPAGLEAAKKARSEGLLEAADQSFTTSAGMKVAEFEDWIDPDLYLEPIRRKFSVNINSPTFRRRKRKWSDRVKTEFENSGQLWDGEMKVAVKSLVADRVATSPSSALKKEFSGAFEGFCKALEMKLTD